MKAIHVNWTAPFFQRSRLRGHGFSVFKNFAAGNYFQPSYSILSTLLSALWWKRENGSIKLYTDNIGASYYEEIGILSVYDEVDTETLEDYKGIDPAYFWTSGKIHCLGKEREPFAFLDQDFIVRSKISVDKPLCIAHWEIPRGYYYFTREKFAAEISHCEFPENYDVDALVPNTSFMIFNELNVRDIYVEMHHKLVNLRDHEVPEWFWLFTDQGILGHVIRETRTEVETLTDRVFLSDSNHATPEERKYGFSEPWYSYTTSSKERADWEHLWYLKAVFRENDELREQTEKRYREELEKHFPKWKK